MGLLYIALIVVLNSASIEGKTNVVNMEFTCLPSIKPLMFELRFFDEILAYAELFKIR